MIFLHKDAYVIRMPIFRQLDNKFPVILTQIIVYLLDLTNVILFYWLVCTILFILLATASHVLLAL